MMSGPIAKEISDEYGVDPKRSASLLDMFTSVGQGADPVWGAAFVRGYADRTDSFRYASLSGVSYADGSVRDRGHHFERKAEEFLNCEPLRPVL